MSKKAPVQKKFELSKNAYGGCSGKDYVPYVPTTEAMPEITGYSIIMGVLFALMFAAANTYLGLKVGMTISAGIPGAILAIGLLRGIFRRNNILEANVVASLSAMGESLAGGIIFVLPALILLGFGLSITTIVIVTVIGGLMGVFFITPIRRYLIVEEHGTLIYPESMAAAEVLVTGTEGAGGFKTCFSAWAWGPHSRCSQAGSPSGARMPPTPSSPTRGPLSAWTLLLLSWASASSSAQRRRR